MLCPMCGTQPPDGHFICPHHSTMEDVKWHIVNRLMCRGIHEGIWPERLSQKDREEYSYE